MARLGTVHVAGGSGLCDAFADLRGQDWVADAVVRVREQGRQFLGEALVAPRSDERLVERIEEALKAACALDWRLIQLLITPVAAIPDEIQSRRPDRA